MEYANLVPIIGTIINITNTNNCCNQMISLNTDNGIANFTISADTKIIDDRQLRRGMRIAAFYDSSRPMILIFPPQYQAQIIAVLGRNEQVTIQFFNNNLVADDMSLQLNLSGNTDIRTINGQSVNCNPRNNFLLVYYTMTTRSIPPQTTPRRIVVLC